MLCLVVFGQILSDTRAIPTGDRSYLELMATLVLAQGVLFSAIFQGIAVVRERDLGIGQKLLVSPADRTSLVLGKVLAAGIRGVPCAVVIYLYLLVAFPGVHHRSGIASVAEVLLLVACVVMRRERSIAIGQHLTMPLFLAGNAIYPIDLMPGWL